MIQMTMRNEQRIDRAMPEGALQILDELVGM